MDDLHDDIDVILGFMANENFWLTINYWNEIMHHGITQKWLIYLLLSSIPIEMDVCVLCVCVYVRA
jgi:hypothetical protein